MIPVKVIAKRSGGAALVEWGKRRAYVPTEEVIENKVSSESLEAGVPYGLNWEDLIEITVTPAAVAAGLYRRGIWRACDMTHQDVRAAFLEAISDDASALFAKAMEVSK